MFIYNNDVFIAPKECEAKPRGGIDNTLNCNSEFLTQEINGR